MALIEVRGGRGTGDLTVEDYYNIYSGNGVLENPKLYLRRPAGETDQSYNDRCAWASWPNWCKKAHTIYLGYLFSSKPKIEPNQEFCILSLAHSAAHNSLIGGYAWIVVLPSGPAVYRADRVTLQENGMRGQIHGLTNSYSFDFDSGLIMDNNNPSIVEDFEPDQLILVKWNETKDSLFVDVGPLNIEIFNLNSIKKYHIIRSLHWFLEGRKGEEPHPYDFVPRDNDQPPLTFVQPDNSSMIDTINKDVIETILNIGSILGLSAEFEREIRFQTGISKMIDLIDTNAIVKMIATNISKACNMAAVTFQRLRGGPLASIQIDPILRPTEDKESIQELKDAQVFVNNPDITKILQKEMLKITLLKRGYSMEELEPLLIKIEQGDGIIYNEFKAIGEL